jgi:hypothetical protein
MFQGGAHRDSKGSVAASKLKRGSVSGKALRILALLAAAALPNATGNVTDGAGCGSELTVCRDVLSLQIQAAAELRGNLSQLSADKSALVETVAWLRLRVAELEAQSTPARVISAPVVASLPEVPYTSAPNSARRREEPPTDSKGVEQCYRAGSSFDPTCGCLQRPTLRRSMPGS